jgi:CRISPR type II-A-associated protein Csn2
MNELIFSRYDIEPDIIITETHFFTLSVENKPFLLEVLSELRNQTENGKEGDFHLLLNDKPVNIEKSTSIIFDFTDIDFNAKTITNLLTRKFCEFLGLGEQTQPLSDLENIILNLAEDLRVKSGINI